MKMPPDCTLELITAFGMNSNLMIPFYQLAKHVICEDNFEIILHSETDKLGVPKLSPFVLVRVGRWQRQESSILLLTVLDCFKMKRVSLLLVKLWHCHQTFSPGVIDPSASRYLLCRPFYNIKIRVLLWRRNSAQGISHHILSPFFIMKSRHKFFQEDSPMHHLLRRERRQLVHQIPVVRKDLNLSTQQHCPKFPQRLHNGQQLFLSIVAWFFWALFNLRE